MERIKQRIKDWLRGTSPLLGGVARSKDWPKIRAEHLKKEPVCQITGSSEKLEVHHIESFHLHPEKELLETNLITLSEKAFGCNIHLLFGHLGNFRKENLSIREDVKTWNQKLK